MTTAKQIKERSVKATINHIRNMKKLSKGVMPDYSYLDTCWICGKKFTFWDKINFNVVHSFEGNSHRRNCI